MTAAEMYAEWRASRLNAGYAPRTWYFLQEDEKAAWEHVCEQAKLAFSNARALNREIPCQRQVHGADWSNA